MDKIKWIDKFYRTKYLIWVHFAVSLIISILYVYFFIELRINNKDLTSKISFILISVIIIFVFIISHIFLTIYCLLLFNWFVSVCYFFSMLIPFSFIISDIYIYLRANKESKILNENFFNITTQNSDLSISNKKLHEDLSTHKKLSDNLNSKIAELNNDIDDLINENKNYKLNYEREISEKNKIINYLKNALNSKIKYNDSDDNINKGIAYEHQILNTYDPEKWTAYWNGLQGKNDNGIDLIMWENNGKSVHLIQCKNHRSTKPSQNDLNNFFVMCEVWFENEKEKCKIFDRHIKKIFISNLEPTEQFKKMLEESKKITANKDIEFKKILWDDKKYCPCINQKKNFKQLKKIVYKFNEEKKRIDHLELLEL